MQDRDVTIIGAGITGIMAANTLRKEGIKDIHVIEKSKSVGGRLATRRIENGKADHGAQFFTVRTSTLQEYADAWVEKGWVKHWFGDPYPRYTSVDGMNHLVKRLSENIQVTLQAKVMDIKEVPGGFQVTLDNEESFKTGAILITAPVPQAVELLQNQTLTLNVERIKELSNIQFQRALVGMFTMSKSTSLPSNGHVDKGLPEGVERIVDHHKKGISSIPVVSVYMRGEWSDHNFLHQDELTLRAIKESVMDYIEPLHVKDEQLKKWRYAQASSMINQSYVNVHQVLPLYVAGDAFLRPTDQAGRTRFESAFLSGIDVGNQLATMMKGI
ncbi:NAD(P)/FAD-dependent oxidoreductase [Pontibacillus sp. HMF3514]|uniref:NAD(P)/FAD-dependent oxidoreductase n=1 Tax=Pontibacillus sp. HMF3514 TaxID=2692425 RepID=UPI00131F9448|nr:FAD-dependent oxidoreductase [Pontibacillus sp. HMF3514]QHE53983.1 NAD(P)-binding protein [Pontibacillus sp. HMF3514]